MPRKNLRAVVAALTTPIAGEAQRTARVQLLPAGRFRSSDVRPEDAEYWTLENEQAQTLLAAASARANPFVVDYEHATIYSHYAPAAGWFSGGNLQFVPNEGLFAVLTLTDTAAAHVAADEYRFVSAVFSYLPVTGDVLELHSVALTNDPAIDGMQQLRQAATKKFFSQPSEQEIEMTHVEKSTEAVPAVPAGAAATSATTVNHAAASGTPTAAATPAESTDSGSSTPTPAPAPTPAPTPAPATEAAPTPTPTPSAQPAGDPSPTADRASEIAVLTRQVRELQDANTLAEKEMIFTAALTAGRVLPAQKPILMTLPTDSLRKYIESTPTLALLSRQAAAASAGSDAPATLTEADTAQIRRFGLDEKEFAAAKRGNNHQPTPTHA